MMTTSDFRRLALSFPETSESAHMGHPDFRVGGKIFATVAHPAKGWAMVKLTPEQQEELIRTAPAAFTPVKGGWGRQGATAVYLKNAKRTALAFALEAAWRNRAPKRLFKAPLVNSP
jgi:hypothetical protein